ncbi:MAG: hypothetical protein DRQ59_14775 [Gammaproteobacteria bacterium]|nr:MAG: hypothetical protein DRQ59_14775 [Gammaproteobacteria bacterium]
MAKMDSPTAPLFVDLVASHDAESFELAGEIDGIAGVLAGEPLGLDVTLNAAGATVMIKGAVARPLEADGIDMTVQVSGDSLSRLTELATAPVTGLGEYQISVTVAGNADAIALSNLAVSLEAAGAQIGVSGSISDAIAVTGVDVAVEVKGDSLAALSTLADTELPDLGAFSMLANIAGTAEKINVTDLSIDIAGMQIDGNLKADIGAEPLLLEATLHSEKIDLTRLLPADEAVESSSADAIGSGQVSDDSNERMFPDDPLPLDSLDALDTIDAVVKLKIDELIVDPETTLTNLDIGLHAANKRVSILPLKFSVMGATIDGRVGLEVVQEAAAVATMLNIHHPSVGDLVEDDSKTMLVGGPFDMVIDVTGNGASVRDIMASLNGSLTTELGAAQASSQWMQRMFAEVTAILTKTVPKRGTTEPIELHCMVTDFRITNGVAEAESFVVDARNITLFGDGRIDLRDESLHLDFDWLAARAKTQNVLPPFKVRGTLMSPSSRFDTKAMLGNVLGLGDGSKSIGDDEFSDLTAATGSERCRQRLIAYRKIQDDRARPKEITVEQVLKDVETTKDVLKKLGGFFKRKK